MKYTASQIEKAKAAYTNFLVIRTVSSYMKSTTSETQAEFECEAHNSEVEKIQAGCVETTNKWKFFFLNEVVKSEQKEEQLKAKKTANKVESNVFLAKIKDSGMLLGDYYKWINTAGNKYRREHFSKKYTQESVNAFLNK